jgi:two-component system NtrC family sensor kinase
MSKRRRITAGRGHKKALAAGKSRGRARPAGRILRIDRAEPAEPLTRQKQPYRLGQLPTGLAHEINNGLGAVCGCTGSLVLTARRLLDELAPCLAGGQSALTSSQRRSASQLLASICDMAEIIEKGAMHAATLVNDMNQVPRPINEANAEFDPEETMRDCLRLLSQQFGPRIKVAANFGKVGRIPGSATRVQQVFMNLLLNASQAIEGSGKITIFTRRRGAAVRISIRDTGRGIPVALQRRIFEPYFTTKGSQKGTGLGLSISREIVEGLGGSLAFRSRPNAGTEFVVTLPARTSLPCQTAAGTV